MRYEKIKCPSCSVRFMKDIKKKDLKFHKHLYSDIIYVLGKDKYGDFTLAIGDIILEEGTLNNWKFHKLENEFVLTKSHKEIISEMIKLLESKRYELK